MTLKAGMRVVFVPSHDAEYNHQPNVGVVSAVDDSGKLFIKYYSELDNFSSIRFSTVDPEYAADYHDSDDIVRLLRKINNLVLEYQRLLYLVEINSVDDNSRLMGRIKNRTHYHIN